MPFQQAIWRVGDKLTPLINSKLPSEDHLEEFIGDDISILEPDWMLIGRQVRTAFGKVIDLLALDEEGSVIVIELKKHQTERSVTAQTLDYGSWVQSLDQEDLSGIFMDYQARYHKGQATLTLEDAFKAKYHGFDYPGLEGTVGSAHQLVVVAAEMDASTERIITYLREIWDIPIRAVFFRVYKDNSTLYLSRHWLKEEEPSIKIGGGSQIPKGTWNGVWCMTFGNPVERSWKDAMKWGYVAAGGGPFWGPRLLKLKPQDQLLVWVPDAGYTAVAEVEAEAVPAKEFQVPDEDGNLVPFSPAHVENPKFFSYPDNPQDCEYIVKVRWLGSGPVSRENAFKQDGLFVGLSLPVYRPVKSHWEPTVVAVKKHFNV
jgi:hypothetical protein